MRSIFAGSLLVVLVICSCTGNRVQPSEADDVRDSVGGMVRSDTVKTDTLEMLIAETPMPETADELFDDFIFNFAANPTLQLERIRFPLLAADGDHVDTLRQADWQMEHFFMRQGYYTLLLDNVQQMEEVKNTSVSHVTIEKIYLDKRRVRQYLFSRVNGLWMMTAISNGALADNANADFLMFYEHFTTDSLFQAHSLNGIVEFVGPDPDNDDEQMEGIITDDTWPAFAPELPSKMIYNIVYDKPSLSTEQKIFLLRGIANGQELVLTFKRMEGRWKLTKMTT